MATTQTEPRREDVIAGNISGKQNRSASDYTQREKLLTMSGVLLVMLLASLDQTIVDTAMPRIISDLQGFNLYTWVTTAYLLTSTVMVPIYGKLSDIFGRKPIFLVGVVLFLLGSAASGASQSMIQLVAFRAFQGIGAAALMPIAMAVIGDIFTPRERGRWQGVTGAVFGLSSVLGPAIGGWITDNSSWRWIFYVNIPVGLLALLVLIFLMPSLHSQRTGKAMIDYVGAVLLIIGTVPFLLGFTWAGSQYAWLSPQILSLFAAALVFLTAFFLYERRLERNDAQPIIDPSLFKNRIFSVSIIITAITGMGMFGCIVFLPLYSQGVLGISATNSGLRLIPLMGGLILSSIISGMLVSRFGKYKWIAFTGMIITVGGSLLLQQLNVNSTTMDLIISMIVLGLGLGFSMSIYTVIVQNALPQKIGQATSGLTFFRSIGGTVAVAAMGSVLNSSYIPEFHKALPAAAKAALGSAINTFDDPNILLSADSQRKVQAGLAQQFGASWHPLYNQLTEAIKVGLTNGIHNVFVLSTIIMCFAFIALFFLKEIPLSGDRKSAMRNEGLEDAESAMVSMVPFE
ncbi:MAG TPA: MDR family MFS transporter [Ktedonobacteraceae bacterium]|jgi:EmrB/QacA subfamily drug resistance transporter|nr:MDR family MFS transporter [Ktedonobacteraceae bacterium]